MTNYERLLDLPLREVLKELGEPSLEEVIKGFSCILNCENSSLPCSICDDIEFVSCANVCKAWLNKESDPNANYNDDVWRDADVELPACGDTTESYIAVITGASQATLLAYDGDNFIDPDTYDYITYKVKYWRPAPELPSDASEV